MKRRYDIPDSEVSIDAHDLVAAGIENVGPSPIEEILRVSELEPNVELSSTLRAHTPEEQALPVSIVEGVAVVWNIGSAADANADSRIQPRRRSRHWSRAVASK